MMIDVHGHIGRIVPDRAEFIDVTNLIAKMDAWGIEKTCILPVSEHPEGAYLNANTEDVIAACAHYPDRLIPFCLIDPRFGNRPGMDFSYLLEEYVTRGCKGIGELLPKMDFDDPLCINLYKQAGRFSLPVLFDMMNGDTYYGLCDEPGYPRLEKALMTCPDTIFIGHGPSFWAGLHDSPEKGGSVVRLMRKYENLWADTSANSGYKALTKDMSYGIEFLFEFCDRIMFGTDSCKRSDLHIPYKNVEYIRDIEKNKKLPKDKLDKIKHENSIKLLKL